MCDYPFNLFGQGENFEVTYIMVHHKHTLKCPAGFGCSSVNREDWALSWDKKCLSKWCLFHVSQEKIFYSNITNVKIPDPEWTQHFSTSYAEVSLKFLKNYFFKIKQISVLCEAQ